MVRAESFKISRQTSSRLRNQQVRAESFENDAPDQQQAKINNIVIETASAQISFFEAGKESNLPALVLLPGLFCSANRLITAMLPLAEQTRLVAVDWRGHGKSVAQKGFQVKDLAADVMAVIRMRLKGSKVCILGHSMGARVLWTMLDSYKRELSPILEGVAIIDQGPSASTGKSSMGPADHEHVVFKRDSQMIGSGKRQMMQTLKRIWAEDRGFIHSGAELRDWLNFASECDHVAGSSLHWDALTTDYTHIVRSMSTKVLLMIGDSTLAPGSIYQRMGPAVPPTGAHFAVLPFGTHCPHFQPELAPEIFRLVRQLLNGCLEMNVSPGSFPNGKAHKTPTSQINSLSGPVLLGHKMAHPGKRSPRTHSAVQSHNVLAVPAPTMAYIQPPPMARLRFMGA